MAYKNNRFDILTEFILSLPSNIPAIPEAGLQEMTWDWQEQLKKHFPNILKEQNNNSSVFSVAYEAYLRNNKVLHETGLLKEDVFHRVKDRLAHKKELLLSLEERLDKIVNLFENRVAHCPYDSIDADSYVTERQHAEQSFIIALYVVDFYSEPTLAKTDFVVSNLLHDVGRLVVPLDQRKLGHRTHNIDVPTVLGVFHSNIWQIGLLHGLSKSLLAHVSDRYKEEFLTQESQDSLKDQSVWKQYTRPPFIRYLDRNQDELTEIMVKTLVARVFCDEGAKEATDKQDHIILSTSQIRIILQNVFALSFARQEDPEQWLEARLKEWPLYL